MECMTDLTKKDKIMAVATTVVHPSTRVFVTPPSTSGSMEKQQASASNHQGSTNKPGRTNTHRTSSVIAKHVHRAPVLQHKDEGLSVSTLRKIKRRLFLEAVNSDTHHQQPRTESSPRKQRTNNSVYTGSGKENDMDCG